MNLPSLLFGLALVAAAQTGAAEQALEFVVAGELENQRIDEASGLQAGDGGVFFVHNDDKRDVFVIDRTGRDLGWFKLHGARSRDREDITRVPGPDGKLLVIGDIGDNQARRKDVELFFFDEPKAGEYDRNHEISHAVSVRYPDGPRDSEAMAHDADSNMILLLTKRDVPPRLYGVPLDDALTKRRVDAVFLAEMPGLRRPTAGDIILQPGRGLFVSQPTGMDISPDGHMAAVITYRSLYLFERNEGQSWAEAFTLKPLEIIGPPGTYQEAVAFSTDGRSVYVTSERRPAPLHRLDLP